MTDAQFIAARWAAERAKDAADLAAYHADCLASWDGHPAQPSGSLTRAEIEAMYRANARKAK